MSNLRERQLAEGIKNKLIGIQKSEQINKELSKWERNALLMDEREIERVASSIATKVEKYALALEKKTGNQPSSQQIIKKIQDELNKI